MVVSKKQVLLQREGWMDGQLKDKTSHISKASSFRVAVTDAWQEVSCLLSVEDRRGMPDEREEQYPSKPAPKLRLL